MAVDREFMIHAGWRQGAMVLPHPNLGGHETALGFLVLNQTCDCVNPDFEKEPYLELLPLKILTGKSDSNFIHGKNPRQIHFQILERKVEIWVNAKISEIFHHHRSEHASLEISKEHTISQPVLDDLIHWRAQRYLRTAFPDSFEAAWCALSKKFGKIISRHENTIDSLLLHLSPFEEIEDEESYEIQLRLMVTPEMMGKPETIEQLKKAAEEIQSLFENSSKFFAPKCSVTNLDEMTLWERKRFVDFTRYDYLSFGQEDTIPKSSNSDHGQS